MTEYGEALEELRAQTLREHLEAIRDGWIGNDGEVYGHSDYEHAVAALAILDNATRHMDAPNVGPPEVRGVRIYSGCRLVPDPEQSS